MNTTGIVLSLTDEQLKDIDEYCEMTQHIESGEQACVSLYELRGLLEELRSLRAENAELAKDAGRLEWMVTEGAVIARMNGTGLPMCYQVSFPFESCQQLDWFPSWREAVDAIMATQ